MKISYKILSNLKELKNEKILSDFISWPGLEFTLQDDESGKKIELQPDIAFWWLDTIIGAVENDRFDNALNEITGYNWYINFPGDRLVITKDRENSQKLFESNISKASFLCLLIKTAKQLQKEVEDSLPQIKDDPEWKSYYFVTHYEDVNQESN